MGVGVNARRDSNQDILDFPPSTGHFVDKGPFPGVVYYNATDVPVEGGLQLIDALVVAVKVDQVCREVGGLCDGELTAGYDIQAEPFLVKYTGEGGVDVGLAGVEYLGVGVAVSELIAELGAHVSEGYFVENVEGCTEFASEVYEIAAADGQVVLVGDCSGRGESGEVSVSHVLSLGGGWKSVRIIQGWGCIRGSGAVRAPRLRGGQEGLGGGEGGVEHFAG